MVLQLRTNSMIAKIGDFLFSILLFVLMLDPSNAILHLKTPVFILFLGFNILFYKPNPSRLLPLFAVFSVLFGGVIMATVQNNRIDEVYLSGVFKGFSPLLLLPWIHHYDVLKIARSPALITCLVILTLYGIISSSDVLQKALFLYSREHNEMVMITTRNVLGFKVFGMYYRSIVSIIPILFYFLYKLFNAKEGKWLYIGISSILVITFFISGTRSMMLTPLFLLGVIFYNKWSRHRQVRYYLYPLLSIAVGLFLILIYLLATQEGDTSNSIKYGHLTSYKSLFNDFPQYLLWGQGTATTFYSEGFNTMTAETEWIYIELFRSYGLLAFIILLVYLAPLYYFFKYKENQFFAGLALCYSGFLLIAGTNPFLLNSQGMTVLWICYSQVYLFQRNLCNEQHDSHISHCGSLS